MKRTMKSIVGLVAAATLLGACAGKGGSESSDKPHVGILQYVDHASLDATRKGFEEGLKEAGYEDGKNIAIDYQNAQADQSNLQTISEKLVADNDLILAIATPAAQAVATATTEVPILFTAVTDPVGAELVASMEKPGSNVTGTSDAATISKQVELIQKAVPNAKKIGILYNANERNSQVQYEEAKKEFEQKGYEVIAKTVASTNDVQDVATSLMKQTDAIFIPTDNTIASTMTLLGELAKEQKKAVIGGSQDMVKEGGLATYGTNYESLGKQTAKMAVKILKGAKPEEVPAEYPEELDVVVNEDMAKAIGIDPASLK